MDTRLAGVALLVAPILLFVSGLFAGVLTDDVAWQGAFGQYAGLAFIAANLAVAGRIREHRPRLGAVNTVFAAVGAALVGMAFSSYASVGLAGFVGGFDARVMLETVANSAVDGTPHPSQYLSFIFLLVPLSWIILGVSSWVAKSIPRPSAVLIVLGGVAFASAQAVLNETGEIVTPVLLFAGMAPVGLQLLFGGARAGQVAPAAG